MMKNSNNYALVTRIQYDIKYYSHSIALWCSSVVSTLI